MHSQPAAQTATKARQPYVCALPALAAATLFCTGTTYAAERTVTPTQQAQAVTATQAGIPGAELSATVLAQYTVRRGDTPWAISGKCLKRPYRWPELWGMNHEQIRSPRLIYPDQILCLRHTNGHVRLPSSPASADGNTVRLSLHTCVSGQDGDAISSTPSAAIEPFLAQPIVVDEDTLATPACIFSLPEGRIYLGKGENTHTRGLPQGEGGQADTEWQTYCPIRPLKDPMTSNVLGYEADFLGTLRVMCAAAGPQTMIKTRMLSSKEEIDVGSQLMPLPPRASVRYVPHAPKGDMHSAVAKVTGGVCFDGAGQVVVLNIGSQQRLKPGHVLSLARADAVVKDATVNNETVQLPTERYDLALVFRVFPHAAYTLVTDVSNAVEVGDSVSNPMSQQP